MVGDVADGHVGPNSPRDDLLVPYLRTALAMELPQCSHLQDNPYKYGRHGDGRYLVEIDRHGV